RSSDLFLYRTPPLRDRTKRFRDTARAWCARDSAGRTVPGNRPAHSADHHGVSGRIRGYGVAHRSDAARTADQWRREHALHEQSVDRRRQAHDHGYLPHRHRLERRTDADAKPCPGRFATVAGRRTASRCTSEEGDTERSEERRVGKECRSRRSGELERKKVYTVVIIQSQDSVLVSKTTTKIK